MNKTIKQTACFIRLIVMFVNISISYCLSENYERERLNNRRRFGAVYLNRRHQHLYYVYSTVHTGCLNGSLSVQSLIHYNVHETLRLVLILVQSEHHMLLLQPSHSPALYTPLQHQRYPTNHHTLFPTDHHYKPPLDQHRDYCHSPTSRSQCLHMRERQLVNIPNM